MTVKVDQHGLIVQASRPYSAQNVAIGAASAQSATFSTGPLTNTYTPAGTPIPLQNNTTHIRVVATSACWIAFGANPVAASGGAGSIYLPAFTPEYFWVVPGERLAVIQDTASGNLNIGELVS